jgi:serine/threonine protein kinase
MLTKTYYFDGRSRNQLDNNIMSQKFKIPSRYGNWSQLLKDLLEKGYIKDFRRRPTMLEYIEHPVFDPVKSKHTENVNYVSKIKFPANKNKVSNSDNNPSNYNKISNNVSEKEMIYQKLEVKLVNYINNLKNYFDLYVNLKNRDLVLALASLKRYLQHMTLVNIFFHNKKYIPTGMFRESGIDQNEWASFFNMKQSKKFIIRIYHHLYVAIMEFKSSWTVLENDCRQKKKSNPIKVEISQSIKNSFIKGIEKMIEVLVNETDRKLFDAKNNMKTLLKLENNPPLFFRS